MSAELQIEDKNRLLIVTVNYRTGSLVVDSLRSLQEEIKSVPGAKVVIVDNNSGDDSVEKISNAIAAEGWQDWATLLPSKLNGGYAYGNNYAIRPALQTANPPDYFLLLNPDTQVRPGALKALIDFMDQHPEVGISGSSFEEADGKPWPYAFRFPSIFSELDSALRLGVVSKLLSKWIVAKVMDNEEEQIDWLPGASMMIRRQVFESIGLMDEGYFLYFEETDFCLQARRAGWTAWYVPQSRVMHILGQSTGVTATNQPPKRLPQYWFDSRRRYFLKNHGWFYTALVDIAWLSGFSLWRVRRMLQRKPDTDPPQMLADTFRNSVFLKQGIPCQKLPSI
ncbi:glycosyltransferase family 2 protein [Phormidium sp. CLA17]|uniref:glycosyltransferase family 2 protein n=1 Tax=Leptolyngbya sp. Cla-17 TaxID=2803751 RepID=UPI001493248A|nr:glycosyltransferase family 2 protein [Leptolyngbya sp. Cla-17]MBM0743855.1 glycosyltransferase family 2 protein [Leptolyngbya sp. Cla-17]